MSGSDALPPLQLAASLVVFRDGHPDPEILMLRRAASLAFAAGRMVFPGGRLEAEDAELAQDFEGDIDWNAARIAAIRETLEETGLLVGVDKQVEAAGARQMRQDLASGRAFGEILAAAGISLALDTLVPFARWQPPGDVARRFDTRFVMTAIGTGNVSVSADGSETTDLVWASAREMLARAEQGEAELMFPTRANLMQLARFPDFAAAREDCALRDMSPILARIEDREDGRWLTIDDGHGFPDVAMPLSKARRG